MSAAPAPGGQRARRWALWIAPATFLAGISGGIAFPILPLAGLHAGLPLWFIGVVLAANRFTRVLCSPFVGGLIDRFGGRRTLISGMGIQCGVMALYLVGTLLGRPGAFFLAARMLHGLGSSCVFVGGQTLALQAGGTSHGGTAAGIVRAAQSAGLPAGLVVGGLLASWVGEAATFEAALVAVVVGVGVAAVTVPELGAKVQGRLGRGLRELLERRRLWAIGAVNFALSFSSLGVVLTTLVLVVQERHLSLGGLGPQGVAGGVMGVMVLTDVALSPALGHLGDRLARHGALSAAGIALTLPGLLLVGLAHGMPALVAGAVLLGVGMAAIAPSLLAILGREVPSERRGRATGLLQVFGDLGGTLGPIVGTALLAAGSATPYLLSAGLVACALPVALWLGGRERGPEAKVRRTAPGDPRG